MTGFFESGSYMTTREFAGRLGVSMNLVHQWVHAGQVSPRRVGPTLLFTEADVRAVEAMRAAATRGRRSDLERPTGVEPTRAYVTIEQAARLLNCTERTVARRIASGRLQAWRTDLSPTSLLRADVEALAAAEDGVGVSAVA